MREKPEKIPENAEGFDKFGSLLMGMELEDFLGLATLMGVSINSEPNVLRRDFQNMENEMRAFFTNLPKQQQKKTLKRMEQIVKENSKNVDK